METQCLDMVMMADYVHNSLAEDQKRIVQAHLAECDLCLEEVAMLKLQLHELKAHLLPSPNSTGMQTAMNRIRNQLTRFHGWVMDMAPPVWLLQHNFAAVRSASAQSDSANGGGVLVVKTMQDLRTEMYIRKSQSDRVCIWIKVFRGQDGAKNISLTLIKEGGRPLARYLSGGYEFFNQLGYGTYALVLEQGTTPKGEFLFQVDNKGVCEK